MKGVIPVNVTDADEILEHFGITEVGECNGMFIFSSEDIDKIGVAIQQTFGTNKGRIVINYDPAYPAAIWRAYI